ncbi:hypothetical protein RND71_041457 [Anisodus tanguticus]|uniref:Uncharacterized protein n=1 Tax=Anisodus tanguticus TaxID=243964 RepID=A0AAE1QUM1_9SOLA|nr:hypothetical protein RND71_041457 [Anisodus tanguticus]
MLFRVLDLAGVCDVFYSFFRQFRASDLAGVCTPDYWIRAQVERSSFEILERRLGLQGELPMTSQHWISIYPFYFCLLYFRQFALSTQTCNHIL